jgi:hypothetical protein
MGYKDRSADPDRQCNDNSCVPLVKSTLSQLLGFNTAKICDNVFVILPHRRRNNRSHANTTSARKVRAASRIDKIPPKGWQTALQVVRGPFRNPSSLPKETSYDYRYLATFNAVLKGFFCSLHGLDDIVR